MGDVIDGFVTRGIWCAGNFEDEDTVVRDAEFACDGESGVEEGAAGEDAFSAAVAQLVLKLEGAVSGVGRRVDGVDFVTGPGDEDRVDLEKVVSGQPREENVLRITVVGNYKVRTVLTEKTPTTLSHSLPALTLQPSSFSNPRAIRFTRSFAWVGE